MKTNVEAMVRLASSGNSRTVEELWMTALDQYASDPVEMVSWVPILEKLAELDRISEAEPLAWAAIESLQETVGIAEAIGVAGQFLLALNQSDDLKTQVAELYSVVYADRENLDVLLEEAGIAGGRPPRRALRTLDVCLNIEAGTCLVTRYEDEAARVQSINTKTWEVTIETPSGRNTFGPVEFADNYTPVDENDFRVLLQFSPDCLRERLLKKPDQVVIEILRANNDHFDSDALRELLTEKLIPDGEWTKWWSKARTALKRNPNVQVSGRSPYELSYHAVAVTLESETEAKFKGIHDPAEQLACIESYFRERKNLEHDPDLEMLARFKQRIDKTAQRQIKARVASVLTTVLVSRRVAVMMGESEDEADRPVIEFLAAAPDPKKCLRAGVPESLWATACRCLRASHPERYMEHCEALLPEAPSGACDMLARDLIAGGINAEQLDALVQRILRDPVSSINALVWMWRGPDQELNVPLPPLPTLCAKLVAVAGEIRRRDELSRADKKRIQDCVREALSANQYARFKKCLAQTSAEVAATWRTQIARLDNLGRSVPEDLVKLIRSTFPEKHRVPEISPWKRDDILYVTAAGRGKLSQATDELVNVKMRENAKAIGEAAAHGDLSENSEYKFALEERDLLRARLAMLQEQLSKATVLDAGEVPEDHIGFGTRVTLRGTDNGQTCQMTFLGAGETDVNRNIYNYQSPMGQALMGQKPGDTVELNFAEYHGAYVVERIENALRD